MLETLIGIAIGLNVWLGTILDICNEIKKG